jgi:hypothetical protein
MKQRTQIQGVTEVTVDVIRPKKDKVINFKIRSTIILLVVCMEVKRGL